MPETKTPGKPQDAPQAPPAKKNLLTPLLLGLLLVQNAVGLWFLKPWAHKPAHAESAEPAEPARPSRASTQSVLKLEPLVVNLADPGKHRYVRGTLELGLGTKEAAALIAGDPVQLSPVRQLVIDAIASRVADEIVTSEGKLKLREEIKTKLNSLPLAAPVIDVFITDFLVQF